MAEDLTKELNQRQILGTSYTERTVDLSPTISKERDFDNFKVIMNGTAKKPPEIERIPSLGAFVIYYDLDQFKITSNGSGKELDLVKITPEGWTQKAIDLTSPNYMPPEVHDAFQAYQAVDIERQECVFNNNLGPDDQNGDNTILISLWNTLVARYVSEKGPVTDGNFDPLIKAITARRSEVLAALNNSDDTNNPQDVATKLFTS